MPTQTDIREDFEAKAAKADQRAEQATSVDVVQCWRRIAETYRWLDYHDKAYGKWRPSGGGR